MEAQKGGLYADVQTKVVDDATQHNVFVGLDWLQHAATSRDLAIVFLVRTRLSRQQAEILVPDPRSRHSAAEGDRDLEGRPPRVIIAELPGKKVLFIDACHAGAAMAPAAKPVDDESRHEQARQ